MAKNISAYYEALVSLIGSIAVTGKRERKYDLDTGAGLAVEMILDLNKMKHKLIFVGNGASASISSHQATDYWKNGGIRAVAFNDSSLLTCVSNDFGYQHVFEKPIEMFADGGDILVAISSSGRSQNILNAVAMADKKGCKIITLSGFNSDNPLFKAGDLNFYVPSKEYSHVEIIHHSICHYILDIIIETKRETVTAK